MYKYSNSFHTDHHIIYFTLDPLLLELTVNENAKRLDQLEATVGVQELKLSNIESLLEKLTQPSAPSAVMSSPVHTHSQVIPPPIPRHNYTPSLSPAASSSQPHGPSKLLAPVPVPCVSNPHPPTKLGNLLLLI